MKLKFIHFFIPALIFLFIISLLLFLFFLQNKTNFNEAESKKKVVEYDSTEYLKMRIRHLEDSIHVYKNLLDSIIEEDVKEILND